MACGLRRTSTSSPYRMLRVGFVHVKTLAVRNNPISKLYQLFRTRGRPYGLQDSLSTLRLSCSPFGSSTDARLDTGGWLTLTRRGLSPRKIRRAFPGAITFRLNHYPNIGYLRQDKPTYTWQYLTEHHLRAITTRVPCNRTGNQERICPTFETF